MMVEGPVISLELVGSLEAMKITPKNSVVSPMTGGKRTETSSIEMSIEYCDCED